MTFSVLVNNRISNSVSYLKLAGVGKFVLMDVYRDRLEVGLLKNKEAVCKLSCSLKAEDYEVLAFAVKNYSGGMEEISSILKKFVTKLIYHP